MDDPLDTPPQLDDTTPAPVRHSVRYKKKYGRGRLKKTIIWIGALIAVAGIGYEAYRVFTKKSKPLPVTPVAVQQPPTSIESVPKDVPDAGTEKEFTSAALNVKLKYPDTWKVTETSDAGIRLESPQFSFITNEEGSVAGVFRIYIRKGARESDSKYIGRGYAISPSEKLTYTNPGNDQRKETLITKFGLDEPTNFAYFFIAGNFQLNKGDTLGPTYGKEADTFIIAGGYASSQKAGDMGFYTVAPDLPATSNAYKQAVGIIASLQLN
jgi:hypothetical protein